MEFLQELDIVFVGVFPRMTRDFLIEFENPQQAVKAQNVLASVRVDNDDVPLFGEIDNRGNSLFVTLTYPDEITVSSYCRLKDRKLPTAMICTWPCCTA